MTQGSPAVEALLGHRSSSPPEIRESGCAGYRTGDCCFSSFPSRTPQREIPNPSIAKESSDVPPIVSPGGSGVFSCGRLSLVARRPVVSRRCRCPRGESLRGRGDVAPETPRLTAPAIGWFNPTHLHSLLVAVSVSLAQPAAGGLFSRLRSGMVTAPDRCSGDSRSQ